MARAPKANGHTNGNGHDTKAALLRDLHAAELGELGAEAPPRRRPITLPDGRSVRIEELGPELLPGVWPCPERKYLIRRIKDGFRANPWGYPIPLRYECAEAADEDMAETASRITAIWSTDPELGEHTFTMREVNSGVFLARFDSPPFTSRRDMAWIADVLKAQLRSIPRRRVPVFPGWSISPAGAPRFVILGDGERATYHADLTYDGARQIEPASLEDAAFLARAMTDWARDGRGVACLGIAVRGAFASLKSVGTSLVLVGAPGELPGSSTGTGKTTGAVFALGLFGAVPATQEPTANFEASEVALKATIGRRYDHPTVIDDFHRSAQAATGAKVADALDRMFRAAAGGGAWANRGMRDGRLRDPVYLRAGYIFTGEDLPDLLASAERRIAAIFYRNGDCDNVGLYAQWDTLQAIWERIGHAVIRWAMPIFAGPGGPQALARLIGQTDAAWEAAIFEAMRTARPDAPTKYARSIARNWAAIMAGADIADRALGGAEGDGPMVETLRPTLLAFALAQLDRLAAGAANASTFDADFFEAARAGDFLYDGETRRPFGSGNLADAPTMKPLGYEWTPSKDCWLPGRGEFAGWRRRDLGEDWLLPGPLLAGARRRARALGLAFPFSPQTLPAHLTAIGFALAEAEGRHTHRVRVGDELARVLRVPIPTEDEADEAPPAPPPAATVIPYAARLFPLFPPVPAVPAESGTKISEPDQSLTGNVPAVPAVPAVSRAQEGGGNGEAPPPLREIDAKAPNPASEANRAGSAAIIPAKASTGPGERPGAAAGRSRPQKPVAVLDCDHLVLGGEASALPPALSPKKVRRLDEANRLGPVIEWAASRQIGRVVIAQAWAEAAGVQPSGRSQRAIPANGGAPVELFFPDLGEAPAEVIGEALALYQRLTGKAPRAGFTYRGGVQSFWTVLEALDHDSRRELLAQALAPAAFPTVAHAIPEPAADLGWMRRPTPAELVASSCVVIDANSQYLRAMGGHMFGVGDPEHVEAPAFDPRRPGYWRATWAAPDWPATLPPLGWPLAERKEGWIMTETAALVAELGGVLDIKEAWLWEPASALAKVATRLRDALYAAKAAEGPAGELALDMIKRTYKEGIGSMSRREARTLTTPDSRHRPHWRHAIIARSTALILRDLHACGAHPVAIATDGFAFLTKLDPDAFMASLKLKRGLRLGEYKVRPGPTAEAMLGALGAWEVAGAPTRNHATRGRVIGLITGRGE